jgi:hypothetical protein
MPKRTRSNEPKAFEGLTHSPITPWYWVWTAMDPTRKLLVVGDVGALW